MAKPSSVSKRTSVLDGAAASAVAHLLLLRDDLATEAQLEKAASELARRREGGEGAAPETDLTLLDVLVQQGVLAEKKAKEVEKKLDPEALIPGYQILGEVGRGGMGTVFKARQLSMDRVVAVKVLSKKLSQDERYVEKFLYEARAAGKLNHENIVSAIDCGASSGIHYFVMEFVDGEEVMRVLLRDGPIAWDKAFEIAEQVARALDHAHRAGLVHRDVKPENVIWVKPKPDEPPGLKVKLCDLGLAKQAVTEETGEKAKTTEGTPYYASPEQALGRTDIDGRSDIYSLGATLFHLIKGEAPFDGENARQILWKQVHRPFPDLAQNLPEVPEGYRAILAKMVEKDRDARLPNAQAFLEAVAKERARGQEVARRGPRSQAAAGTGVALVGGAVALALLLVAGAVYSKNNHPPAASPTPEVKKSPEASPSPSPAASTGPVLIHVDPVDTPDPVSTFRPSPTPPVSRPGDDAEARAAQALLDAATTFRDEHPDDLSGYTARLRKVMTEYPGTPAAVFADKELLALASASTASFDKDFAKVQKAANALDAQGKFKDAIGLVDELCEKTDARLLAPRKADVETYRTSLVAHARARVDALVQGALAKLAAGQPIDDAIAAIQAVEPDCPAAVVKDAEAKIADLKKRAQMVVADGVLAEVQGQCEDLLAAGKLEDAKALAAGLKDDQRVAVRSDKVATLQRELAQIEESWTLFDSRVKAAESVAKRAFKRRGSVPEVEGQLKDYDPASWTAKVKPFGRKELLPLDLHDLVPDELVGLALPPDASDVIKEGLGFALYFVARREPDAATIALDRLAAAGGPSAPELRDRIAKVRGREHELRARSLVEKALAPNAVTYAADDVIASVKLLAEKYSDTKPYADNLDELRKVYIAARTMRLSNGDIAAMFSGRLVRNRDQFKLEYDFAQNPGSAEDWTADTGVSKDSSSKVQKGRLLTKGKTRHCGLWEGGSLQFDARIVTNGNKPNANLIVNEKPGWFGTLVGFGFSTNGLSRIRVDPGAARKPGYLISLPANVIYELEGQAPQQTGKCWAAEPEPPAPVGKAVHYNVKRDGKGRLQGSVGSQTPLTMAPAPNWDQPGGVAIAGFETEISVEFVTIEGRFEPVWLGDRARKIATAEAMAFPNAPKPPPPAPPKQGG